MAQRRVSPTTLRQLGPVRRMEAMERGLMGDIERFVEDNLPNWPLRLGWRKAPDEETTWAPASEIYELDDALVVRVELPGLSADDIDISIADDSLIVKGERKPSGDIESAQYHRCELCYGNFFRSIPLPAEVQAGKIEAAYDNGMLDIRLPKAKAARPTKIQITAK